MKYKLCVQMLLIFSANILNSKFFKFELEFSYALFYIISKIAHAKLLHDVRKQRKRTHLGPQPLDAW